MLRSLLVCVAVLELLACSTSTIALYDPDASFDPEADGGCVAKSCDELGAECGQVDDGCGVLLTCGECAAPQLCGESGLPNICACPYETDEQFCDRLGAACGVVEGLDLCGATRTVDACGDCSPPLTCGGGGIEGACGETNCTSENDAAFCLRLGKACGPASGTDLCGDPRTVANCGTCGATSSCSAAGQCQACTPTTCAAQGKNCGSIPNGCGKMIVCGTCTAPKSCGGGGSANVCGCTPTTCLAEGATCGVLSNGCGGTLDCGNTCGGTESCQANHCVARVGMRVEGNRLLKDEVDFYPRGFNVIGLLSPDGCTGAPGSGVNAKNAFGQAELLAARDAWKANILRFQVSQRGLDPQDSIFRQSYVDRVKAGVQLARSLGFVVIVSMQDQSIGCGSAHPLPFAATLRAWSTAAPLFKSDPYVMFELFNEPVTLETAAGWQQWRDGGLTPVTDNLGEGAIGHQQIVNHLRGLGANNVLIADGANKGGKLQGLYPNYLLQDTLATKQIMYAIHPYYFHTGAGSTLGKDTAAWETRFGYITPHVPLIVTEWNAHASCFDGQAERIPQFLQWLQDKNIGLMPHAFDVPSTMVQNLTAWTPTSFTGCVAGSDAGQIVQTWFRSLAATTPAVCGDGRCETGESCSSCSADCCASTERPGCIKGNFSVYYGNLHAHTGYSDGGPNPNPANLQATANVAFAAARTGGYHLTILTDHMNNYSHYTDPDNSMLAGEYTACRQSAAANTQPGQFLADCGFEVQVNSAPGGGHANIFFTDALFPVNATSTSGDIVRIPAGSSLVTSFYNYLTACPNCLGQFNHPADSNWNSRALEPSAVDQMKMFELNGGSMARFNLFIDALRKGWRVSPSWNGDNHQQNWGALDIATGLFMSGLDSAPLKRAISERRTIAVKSRKSQDSIKLMADSVCWMGSILEGLGASTLDVEATTEGTAFTTLELYSTQGTGVTPTATFSCAGAKRCAHSFAVNVSQAGAYFAVAKRAADYAVVSAPVWFK